MLAFVTTIRHPAVAYSWPRIGEYLDRTLASVCRQTATSFRVLVVCNEIPPVRFSHPSVEYLVVDLPPPVNAPDSLIENWDALWLDRGKKHLAALYHLKQDPPDYVMFFDADDLVSRRLARFVDSAPARDIYYVTRGYAHQYGDAFVFRIPRRFDTMCGTCNIIRFETFSLTDSPDDLPAEFVQEMLADHNGVARMLASRGHSVGKVPFPGAVYLIGTGENQSGIGTYRLLVDRTWGFSAWKRFASLRYYQPLTAGMCDEFGLPAVAYMGVLERSVSMPEFRPAAVTKI